MRILQLDGLRGLMCLIILLGHMSYLGGSTIIGEVYLKYFNNPTLAVDYFFMLSGFGLYYSNKHILSEKKHNGFKFALGKIKKIYPIYLFSLVLSVPIIFLSNESILKAFASIGVYGGIDLTLFQSITGMGRFSHNINGVAWFLSTLFICYLTCPFFIGLIDKIKSIKQAYIAAFIVFLTIIGLSIFALRFERLGFLGGAFNDIWYGHPIIRCWYLVLGMIIGFIAKYRVNKSSAGNIYEIGVSVIAVLWIFTRKSFDLGLNKFRVIDVLICFLLLLVFANTRQGIVSKYLSKESIIKLGNDSMYLFFLNYY